MIKKIFLALSIFLLVPSMALAAPFTSNQVGSSQANGYVLQTDGTQSHWVATSTLGISGGGGSSFSTSSIDYYNSLFGSWKQVSNFLTPTTTIGVIVQASSTIAALSMTNATATNATTTNLFMSNIFGASLTTCNTSGSSALTWSGGQFGCNTISGGSGITGNPGQNVIIGPASTEIATSTIFITPAGLVGISTTTPQSALDVYGAQINVGTTALGGAIGFRRADGQIAANITANAADTLLAITSAGGGSIVQINSGNSGNSAVVLQSNTGKNVGIASSTPENKLSIALTGGDDGVKVANTGVGSAALFLRNDGAGGRGYSVRSTGSGNSTLNGAGNFAIYDETAAAVRVLIDSNGNAGIGTTTPATRLFVAAPGGSGVASIQATSVSGYSSLDFYNNSDVLAAGFGYGNPSNAIVPDKAYFYTNAKDLQFAYNTTQSNIAMTISGINGHVGIGTTTPNAALTVQATSGNIFTTTNNGTSEFTVDSTGLATSRNYITNAGGSMETQTLAARNGGENLTIRGASSIAGASVIVTGTTAHTQTSGSVQQLAITPIYNQSASSAANTDLLINRTETSIGTGAQVLFDAQVSGSSKFLITNTGNVGIASSSPFTKLVVGGNSYFGGNLTATGTLQLPALATPAGSVLAVDPTGNVIATTTSGGGTTYTGTYPIVVTGSVISTALATTTIQQTYGTAQIGALSFATTSAVVNGVTTGLNITNTGGAFTFTPTVSGTLNNAGLANSTIGITATSPLTGGGTPALGGSTSIGCQAAGTSQAGCLSATDWNTFNGKGSGTVTAIGVTTANGVSGSSSGGSTPNLTLTLGAITPTSVNGLPLSLGTNSVSTNIAIGNAVLGSGSLTGTSNVGLGFAALNGPTSGARNIAIGTDALNAVTTGSDNIGVGSIAGSAIVGGSTNTAIGSDALGNFGASMSGNVALGYHAGFYESTSNNFYVDNQDRTNTAGDKAGALLYGTFNATPASQTLTVNGTLSSSVSGSGSTNVVTVGGAQTITNKNIVSIAATTTSEAITSLSSQIPYANAQGSIIPLTVGTGLSLSGGTLTATGAGSTPAYMSYFPKPVLPYANTQWSSFNLNSGTAGIIGMVDQPVQIKVYDAYQIIQSATAGTTKLQIGVYNTSGTLMFVATSSVITAVTQGTNESSAKFHLTTPTILTPGEYYILEVPFSPSSNTSVLFYQLQLADSNPASGFASSTLPLGGGYTVTSGVIPSSIIPASISTSTAPTQNVVPVIRFDD